MDDGGKVKKVFSISDDWYRAVTAELVGTVRISGAHPDQYLGSPSLQRFCRRRRAAAALSWLLEAWRRGDGPMPTRADWESGRGVQLAGSRYAAGVVWKMSRRIRTTPRYAKRAGGQKE